MPEHPTDNIELFSRQNAIEVANFGVTLVTPIDNADDKRFENSLGEVKNHFPSITNPGFAISFGNTENGEKLPPPMPKELTYFGNDGQPMWVASFGGNQILVSCRKYSTWEKVWPEAQEKLNLLLSFLDPFKQVHSVEFGVTDTFTSNQRYKALIPANIFKESPYIPPNILLSEDPRWDFSQGWFEPDSREYSTLVRIEGRSGIQNNTEFTCINNSHSAQIHTRPTVENLRDADSHPSIDSIFHDFHDMNKKLLRLILSDKILERMGLRN